MSSSLSSEERTPQIVGRWRGHRMKRDCLEMSQETLTDYIWIEEG